MTMIMNEKTGLYENYGFWHVPFWQTYTFQMAIKVTCGVLLLIICTVLIIKYMRYQREKKMLPWDRALFDLAQLKKDQEVSIVQNKEFYVFLTEIIKKYLFARFDYDVLGKTDAEVVNYLQKMSANDEIIENIKVVIQGSEVIKFANAQVAQEYVDNDLRRIILLVKKTIPHK